MADQFGYDVGEFIVEIESYKIPWLIWIQLLVTILVIVILSLSEFSFSSTSSVTEYTSPAPSQLDKPSSSNTHTNQITTMVESRRAKSHAGTSRGSTREDGPIREESSAEESEFLRIPRSPNHPCNYIVLAKEAFLKCFGLHSASDGSDNHQGEKTE